MRINIPLVTLCIYLLYVCALTLSPFQFAWDSELISSVFFLRDVDVMDFVLNTFGFSVFGIILYYHMPGRDRVLIRSCLIASSACLLSAIIEWLQMYIPMRDPSLIDVIGNTMGGVGGFLFASHAYQQSWNIRIMRVKNKLALSGCAVYVVVILIVFAVAAMPQTLDGWDRGFPLLIGNEATLDRPWQGSIFSLLMFDRVLTQDEISAIHASGPVPKLSAVQAYYPIIAYLFDEGKGTTVHDCSQLGEPIDLRVSSPDQTVWLPDGGLTLREQTVLRSVTTNEKIYGAITMTNRFSIATWFQPTTLDQYGPARIVSLSESPRSRNFTIAQEGADLHFRVRDLLSGRNGARWDLKAGAFQSITKPTYAVFVYDEGIKSLYVNGRKMGEVYPPDGLTLIAKFLHFDSDSHWQKLIVGGLLVGGAGMLLSPLAIKQSMT